MFDEFKKLHDNRESDSIQYFSFYDLDGELIRGESTSVTIDDNGQFNVLTVVDSEQVSHTYTKENYTYTTECLYVLGIGFLIPGDIVKLKINECVEYELNYGWHTNISNQTIYSWYLVPKKHPDLFKEDRKGIFRESDINITNTGILTFYKEFLETIEVVEFRKDRNSFNIL
jgi:hypothetical protein